MENFENITVKMTFGEYLVVVQALAQYEKTMAAFSGLGNAVIAHGLREKILDAADKEILRIKLNRIFDAAMSETD